MSVEIIQFIGMLVLMVGILVGSYWFVYAPIKSSDRRLRERQGSGDRR